MYVDVSLHIGEIASHVVYCVVVITYFHFPIVVIMTSLWFAIQYVHMYVCMYMNRVERSESDKSKATTRKVSRVAPLFYFLFFFFAKTSHPLSTS